MNWSTPGDLKNQVAQLWDRGELLRDLVTGNPRFPLRLMLRKPSSADITERFDAVRNWSAVLTANRPFRLEWREVQHRVQGRQRLPESAWIDSLDDALAWIGQRAPAERFLALLEKTRQERPELLSWMEKKPLKALGLTDVWPRLLAVVNWIVEHPRPGVYMRQVDIPGIHSKFIEMHYGILAELLTLVLSADAIDTADTSKTGINRFAARYGFLEKPVGIRFRILDEALPLLSGVCCPDITLDAGSFSQLSIRPRYVFMTENEINFLTFPRMENSIVIFGGGYCWEALARSRWLHDCCLRYWGDIDTDGFAILDQLRASFPHVISFLMDRETLEEHKPAWGEENNHVSRDLPRLVPHERALYDDLRNNRIRKNLRLEQEYIRYSWIQHHLGIII